MRLEDVRDHDEAVYKCRVDYREAPTTTSNVAVNVVRKSKVVDVFMASQQDVPTCTLAQESK